MEAQGSEVSLLPQVAAISGFVTHVRLTPNPNFSHAAHGHTQLPPEQQSPHSALLGDTRNLTGACALTSGPITPANPEEVG